MAVDGCSHALWLLLSCCLFHFLLYSTCTSRYLLGLLIVDLVMSRDAATSDNDRVLGRNQEKGGFDGAWCFWLRLKPEDERKKLRANWRSSEL